MFKQKKTDIMKFKVGDHVQTTDGFLAQSCTTNTYRSGTIRYIKYIYHHWQVYFDCIQTKEVEVLCEINLKLVEEDSQ